MKKCKCALCRLILRIKKIKPSFVKENIVFQNYRDNSPRSDFSFNEVLKNGK